MSAASDEATPLGAGATADTALSVQAVAIGMAAVLAVILSILLGVVFGLIGLPWWIGPILGVIIAAGIVWYLLSTAYAAVSSSIGTTSSKVDRWPRFENLVDGLSLAIGVTDPDLKVIDDKAMNAMSLAQGTNESIVMTTGLLEQLDRMQLEGVIAELLVRIKSGDAERSTVATGLLRPLLSGPLSGVLGGLGNSLLARLMPQDREMTADLAAVSVTRFPPGLGAALRTIAQGSFTPASASVGNDHLWLAPPLDGEGAVPALPLAWRIDTLLEI